MRRRNSRDPRYSDWVKQLLASLDRSGPVGHQTVRFAQDHGIQVGIRGQSAGARWTPWHRIELHTRYAEGSADSPYALSLVVHEVRHLQQGWMTALSVYGELDAWQCQFRFLGSLAGRHLEETDRDGIIARLLLFRLDWDRSVLQAARDLMRAYAGRAYRIDWLPLYPLNRELLFLLTGKRPPMAA